jgi:acyl-CoA thioester hydrolase
MSETFDNCNIKIHLPVAWGEMDAFQHVNNVVYFKYFESARIAYFEETGINEHMQIRGIGPILGSTQCRFKAPLTYPDNITVATKITELNADRFTMKYFVKSDKSGRISAEGEGTIVFFDYNTNQKHHIPMEIVKTIKELDF